MIIWLTGVLLVALGAFIGYFCGGVRSAISLVGVIIAAFLAKTVGAWLAAVVPLLGFKNTIWQIYLPPLLGFLVVSLVVLMIAFLVHHLYLQHYRNRIDEFNYARWVRLNCRAGAAIGAVIGAVWLILLATVVYVPAYLTTQLADADEQSSSLRIVNDFAHGMSDTGLQKIVERFQPAQPAHYQVSDILGLVYNNPAIESRLASYPPFLGMSETPEIAELARDPEINTLIQSRAGLQQILENAKLRAVLDNSELLNQLLALDFGDLEAYLRTGVSERFKGEHILGRWRLNVRKSIAEMKLASSDKLPAVEFNLLRRALNVYLNEMTIGFTTDNHAILKVKAKDEQKLLQLVGRGSSAGGAASGSSAPAPGDGSAPAPASAPSSRRGGLSPRALAAPATATATESTSDLYRQRYGLAGGGAGGGGGARPLAAPLASTTPAVAQAAPPKPSTSSPLAPLMTNGNGTWSKSDDNLYQMQFSADGKEVALKAQVKENQMIASVNGRSLVFDRM